MCIGSRTACMARDWPRTSRRSRRGPSCSINGWSRSTSCRRRPMARAGEARRAGLDAGRALQTEAAGGADRLLVQLGQRAVGADAVGHHFVVAQIADVDEFSVGADPRIGGDAVYAGDLAGFL